MEVNKLIKNLGYLAQALRSLPSGRVKDLNGIQSGISQLESQRHQNSNEFRLDVKNLIFTVPPKIHQHLRPTKATFENVKLGITLKFKGSELLISNILEMNIDIVLHGSENGKNFNNAWHFDFHSTTGDEAFSHPMYHCQNGGKKLRHSPNSSNQEIETGEVFLIESPRIVHPPMDPVLAVDFVFGNFIGNDFLKTLHNNRFFKAAITDSMESLWKPYYEVMFKFFEKSQNEQSRAFAAKLNPTLLP